MKEEEKKMPSILRSIISAPIKAVLRLYLWTYDEEAEREPRADLHRKIIWELRETIRRIGA